MKLIVAVDKEWNIGNKNDLLFYIPDDLKFFRSQTVEKVCVMGRKTLESFPGSKPLKNRVNIVLSRNADLEVEGATFVKDIDELKEELKKYNSDDIYVIGGETIYTLLLPMCDTAVITHIDAVADEADKKFPALSPDEWMLAEDSGEKECNGYKFRWCEYKRK
ncbi:MAG: dihydrofolate reductase [Clostridia bacterium]|nr:dihydrofolate reductase [Clostridia bacterium]